MERVMKELLIKMLGGMTKLEHLESIEKLKDACEGFAVKHMNPKGCSPLMERYPLVNSDVEGDIVIYVSRTSAVNCTAKGIAVAPWARLVFTSGISITPERKED